MIIARSYRCLLFFQQFPVTWIIFWLSSQQLPKKKAHQWVGNGEQYSSEMSRNHILLHVHKKKEAYLNSYRDLTLQM